MKMRIISLLCALISAAGFATIYTKPAASHHHAPKAWAHGVGFVFPRIVWTEMFGLAAIIVFAVLCAKVGRKRAFLHPLSGVTLLALLPAVYVLVFVARVFIMIYMS